MNQYVKGFNILYNVQVKTYFSNIPKNPSAIHLLRNKKNKELHHFSNAEERQFSPLNTINRRYAEIEKKNIA